MRFAIFTGSIELKRPSKTDPKVQRNIIERSFDRVVGCWESSQTHATFQRVVARLVACCGKVFRMLQCNGDAR